MNYFLFIFFFLLGDQDIDVFRDFRHFDKSRFSQKVRYKYTDENTKERSSIVLKNTNQKQKVWKTVNQSLQRYEYVLQRDSLNFSSYSLTTNKVPYQYYVRYDSAAKIVSIEVYVMRRPHDVFLN